MRLAIADRISDCFGRAPILQICLSHQPRTLHDVAAAGADLMLAGHTHGGQIAINQRNLNVARFQGRYIAGPYRRR